MFCQKCGKEITDNNYKCCPYCGTSIIPPAENQQQQRQQYQPNENKSSSGGCLMVVIFFLIQIVNIFISYQIGKQKVEDEAASSVANMIKYGQMTESELNTEIVKEALTPFLIILAVSALLLILIRIATKKR